MFFRKADLFAKHRIVIHTVLLGPAFVDATVNPRDATGIEIGEGGQILKGIVDRRAVLVLPKFVPRWQTRAIGLHGDVVCALEIELVLG